MTEIDTVVLDILRRLQSDMADLKHVQRSIRDELIGIRQQLHALQGDVLRQEQEIAGIQMQLDRVNTRLDLVEH
jgi:predicted  nucleic acid-binding Zn-ribbon protein